MIQTLFGSVEQEPTLLEKLKAAGLRFAYHPHGFEFQPWKEGTLFDLMVAETKPEFVSFELDVFWAVHGGADPVKLLQRYGRRFDLMHIKDLRKGAPTGILYPGDPAAPNRGLTYPDRNNFAPRFGFAWDMLGNAKLVMRGGIGIFYDLEDGALNE